MIRQLKIWWRLRPLIEEFQELTKMRFSVNVAIQMLALVAQALNQVLDLLPPRAKFWALVALSVVQGVVGVLVHFRNPDGSHASLPWPNRAE